MSEELIFDRDGHEFFVANVGGVLVSPFPNVKERILNLPDFEIRNDDVFICSYPKSGCHWMWEITNMLLNKTTEYLKTNKSTAMLEFTDADQLNTLLSPRVLNTHLMLPYLPRELIAKKRKIIYLIRNPKDIAISYYHHKRNITEYNSYKGSWNGFLHLFLEQKMTFGGWFDYVLRWKKDIQEHSEIPVFIVMYEELHQDPFGRIQDLASFLEVDADDEFISKVIDKCSFSNLKAAKRKTEQVPQHKPDASYFRKGVVGDWKNWFTVEQNELFDKEYNMHMKDSGIKIYFEI